MSPVVLCQLCHLGICCFLVKTLLQMNAIFSDNDLKMLPSQLRSMTLMHILNPLKRQLRKSDRGHQKRAAYKTKQMSPLDGMIKHRLTQAEEDKINDIRVNIYKEISRIQYKINYVLGYRLVLSRIWEIPVFFSI